MVCTIGGIAMSIWGAGAVVVAGIGSALIQSKSASKGAEANSVAISEANTVMADAQVRAAELIAAGQVEAAGAIIESAKIAAQASLQAAQLSVEAQERFFAIADRKLEPFREQGLIAQDELASMLGIPNAEGQLVPYDTDRLRDTPGYEFFFQEGQTAVERSAAGTKLSGAQLKAQTQYGQGFAERYFDKQIGYLQDMQGKGLSAAQSLASAATQTGGNIGSTYTNMGNQLSSIYSNQGTQLADVYSSGALSQAALVESLATNQGNLALAAGQNRASLYANQGNAYSDALGGIAYGVGRYGSSLGGNAPGQLPAPSVAGYDPYYYEGGNYGIGSN